MKADVIFRGNHSTVLDGVVLYGGMNNDKTTKKEIENESFEELMENCEKEFKKRIEDIKQNYNKYKLFPRDLSFEVFIDPKYNPHNSFDKN